MAPPEEVRNGLSVRRAAKQPVHHGAQGATALLRPEQHVIQHEHRKQLPCIGLRNMPFNTEQSEQLPNCAPINTPFNTENE